MITSFTQHELLEVLLNVFGILKTHSAQQVLRITQLAWCVFHVKPWLVKQ